MEESEEMGPKIETSITKVYNAPRILMGTTGMDYSNSQWKLMDGDGERDTYQTVMFPEKFKGKPDVQVMLRGVYSDMERSTRIIVSSANVTSESFTVHYHTWSVGRILGAYVTWIAIGE